MLDLLMLQLYKDFLFIKCLKYSNINFQFLLQQDWKASSSLHQNKTHFSSVWEQLQDEQPIVANSWWKRTNLRGTFKAPCLWKRNSALPVVLSPILLQNPSLPGLPFSTGPSFLRKLTFLMTQATRRNKQRGCLQHVSGSVFPNTT